MVELLETRRSADRVLPVAVLRAHLRTPLGERGSRTGIGEKSFSHKRPQEHNFFSCKDFARISLLQTG